MHAAESSTLAFRSAYIAKQMLLRGFTTAWLKILHEAGLATCYGSDLLSVFRPLQTSEFSISSRVLPAKSILKSATINAAEYLGLAGRLGEIMIGAFADFLVLERNPLAEMTGLDKTSKTLLAIVKDGRAFATKVN